MTSTGSAAVCECGHHRSMHRSLNVPRSSGPCHGSVPLPSGQRMCDCKAFRPALSRCLAPQDSRPLSTRELCVKAPGHDGQHSWEEAQPEWPRGAHFHVGPIQTGVGALDPDVVTARSEAASEKVNHMAQPFADAEAEVERLTRERDEALGDLENAQFQEAQHRGYAQIIGAENEELRATVDTLRGALVPLKHLAFVIDSIERTRLPGLSPSRREWYEVRDAARAARAARAALESTGEVKT